MKVLVTGSRTWKNASFIYAKLQHCADTAVEMGVRLTIVHGGCRTGADGIAHGWAMSAPVTVEVHPARWTAECRATCSSVHRRTDRHNQTVCPQAGFYRNEEMVALGADLCLAFIDDGSSGASNCARLAQKAGIETLLFRTGDGATLPGL